MHCRSLSLPLALSRSHAHSESVWTELETTANLAAKQKPNKTAAKQEIKHRQQRRICLCICKGEGREGTVRGGKGGKGDSLSVVADTHKSTHVYTAAKGTRAVSGCNISHISWQFVNGPRLEWHFLYNKQWATTTTITRTTAATTCDSNSWNAQLLSASCRNNNNNNNMSNNWRHYNGNYLPRVNFDKCLVVWGSCLISYLQRASATDTVS